MKSSSRSMHVRKEASCPWEDFTHRIKVGLVVAVVIVVLSQLWGCLT